MARCEGLMSVGLVLNAMTGGCTLSGDEQWLQTMSGGDERWLYPVSGHAQWLLARCEKWS